MVKINKVYTRTGDKGETGLVGGGRVPKDSLRVEAYGTVDELNSHLGMIRTLLDEAGLPDDTTRCARIQNKLFDVGSILASPPEGSKYPLPEISAADSEELEKWIDFYNENLTELRSFVLPGGTILNSALHIARAVCRRAERRVITLSRQEKVPSTIIVYLNRLSDLLFVLARWSCHQGKKPEYLWEPGK